MRKMRRRAFSMAKVRRPSATMPCGALGALTFRPSTAQCAMLLMRFEGEPSACEGRRVSTGRSHVGARTHLIIALHHAL